MNSKVKATNLKTLESIQVDAITQKIDTTSIDSKFKTYDITIIAVRLEGEIIDLNLDNTFYHPISDEVYRVENP
ncbi:hypothetical protein MKI79_00745 [Acinetobacter sp. A3.8]|uniref:Uncharacterized protein n=1 Tax=Acinetobacter sedimenti TaxID=2919922 RepID=A0A9X1WVN2_9GAMM|nr:hypothetical protein [Acinetobacter sedimenti]MCJ8145458.1 hypothetical protein [Acinetobacter sedimenti]